MKTDWISVKDRMPDRFREVLITDGKRRCIAAFDFVGWDCPYILDDKVKWWCELPEIPAKEAV